MREAVLCKTVSEIYNNMCFKNCVCTCTYMHILLVATGRNYLQGFI